MSDKRLHQMSVQELRHERQLAKVQVAEIGVAISGKRGRERIEFEESMVEAKEYVEIINARIARLERVGRN